MTPPRSAMKTMREYMQEEEELHWRRFVHATRPRHPLTMDEAQALCERLERKEPSRD